MRYPATAVPPELSLTIEEMGRVCVSIIEKVALVLKNRDTDRALEVEKDDDAIDSLHRKIIQTLLDPSWQHGIERTDEFLNTVSIGGPLQHFDGEDRIPPHHPFVPQRIAMESRKCVDRYP
jgi:hypothetical protein